ncbi:MAG: SRPBCC family protein [Chitinophagaceae bacterium]|nr:SRPBCC family protein [Chitinophagaceae bacterium]
MTYPVKNISVSINRSADDVYAFTSQPENIPQWIKFIETVSKKGDLWIAHTTVGIVKIKWPQRNDFGVLDHEVTFPNGEVFDNRMRIIPNNDGCEFVFTLFQMPGKTQAEFDEDAGLVTADLRHLKFLMEK